jgi:site-specific DNA-cytosine methylase
MQLYSHNLKSVCQCEYGSSQFRSLWHTLIYDSTTSPRGHRSKDKLKVGETGHLQKEDGTVYCLDTSNTQAIELKEGCIRRLTPIECERLQGYPDNWTEGVSDSQRYKQLGNSVTVNVIEAIAKKLDIYFQEMEDQHAKNKIISNQ